MARELRPSDDAYYESLFRSDLLSQGDIFADVPCGYPVSSQDLADVPGARRLFLTGPLPTGFAMLVTPSCSMGGEVDSEGRVVYDHPLRSLVPVLPVAQFVELGVLIEAQIENARSRDGLINYMFLPAHGASGMPESLALMYLPLPFDHDLLMGVGTRVGQLALEGSRQLSRKLAWFWSSAEVARASFEPPMD